MSNELVNVAVVLVKAVIRNGELSIRGQGSTVTIGEIVDDDLNQILLPSGLTLGASVGKVCPQGRGFGNNVEPREGGDGRDLQSFRFLSGIGDVCSGGRDFTSVKRRQIYL